MEVQEMTIREETTTALWRATDEMLDEAQLAAVAFLARYSGRTLDAYRDDLRAFFQWATDRQLIVLHATRPHIELYRAAMEVRGLAASTIDRRLSTVCGFYRFAHIDGRIPANPAQYVRRPQVQPSEGHGMDRAELGTFLLTAERFDRAHAALAVLLGLNGLRVSEACGTNHRRPRGAPRPPHHHHLRPPQRELRSTRRLRCRRLRRRRLTHARLASSGTFGAMSGAKCLGAFWGTAARRGEPRAVVLTLVDVRCRGGCLAGSRRYLGEHCREGDLVGPDERCRVWHGCK